MSSSEELLCSLCSTVLQDSLDETYFQCSGCGALVRDPRKHLSAEEEKGRYLEHNNDVFDEGYRTFTSPISRFVLEHYSPEHKGLDFGCGPGPVIATVLAENGYEVTLYDPFFHPDESYKQTTYDFIFSCEVFEHFHHPHKEIEALVGLLNAGGRLMVMTHVWNPSIPFRNWYYRNDPTHVFIYTASTIDFIADHFQLLIETRTDRLVVYRKK